MVRCVVSGELCGGLCDACDVCDLCDLRVGLMYGVWCMRMRICTLGHIGLNIAGTPLSKPMHV